MTDTVTGTFTALSPAAACALYEEQQAAYAASNAQDIEIAIAERTGTEEDVKAAKQRKNELQSEWHKIYLRVKDEMPLALKAAGFNPKIIKSCSHML